MTEVLLEIAAWFIGVAVLTVAVRRAFRRREAPRPAPRRNYDALAPATPRVGAERLPTRPLRPYTAQEQAVIETVWGPGTLEVARPLAQPKEH